VRRGLKPGACLNRPTVFAAAATMSDTPSSEVLRMLQGMQLFAGSAIFFIFGIRRAEVRLCCEGSSSIETAQLTAPFAPRATAHPIAAWSHVLTPSGWMCAPQARRHLSSRPPSPKGRPDHPPPKSGIYTRTGDTGTSSLYNGEVGSGPSCQCGFGRLRKGNGKRRVGVAVDGSGGARTTRCSRRWGRRMSSTPPWASRTSMPRKPPYPSLRHTAVMAWVLAS
jgi:hypothetical protein